MSIPRFTTLCYESSFIQEMFNTRFIQECPYTSYFRNGYSRVYTSVFLHGFTPVMFPPSFTPVCSYKDSYKMFTPRFTQGCTYIDLLQPYLIQVLFPGVRRQVYSRNVCSKVFFSVLRTRINIVVKVFE